MIEVWRHHRVVGNAAVGLLVGVFLLLLLANVARTGDVVTAIRAQQRANTGLVDDTHHTAELIQSCVEPTGKCFRKGQKATAGAVADINRVVILAAACASGLPEGMSIGHRQARISSCVINRLARGAS